MGSLSSNGLQKSCRRNVRKYFKITRPPTLLQTAIITQPIIRTATRWSHRHPSPIHSCQIYSVSCFIFNDHHIFEDFVTDISLTFSIALSFLCCRPLLFPTCVQYFFNCCQYPTSALQIQEGKRVREEIKKRILRERKRGVGKEMPVKMDEDFGLGPGRKINKLVNAYYKSSWIQYRNGALLAPLPNSLSPRLFQLSGLVLA